MEQNQYAPAHNKELKIELAIIAFNKTYIISDHYQETSSLDIHILCGNILELLYITCI